MFFLPNKHLMKSGWLLLEEWKFRWGVIITKSLLCPSSAYNPFLKWTLNLGTLAIGISKRGMASPAFRWNKILRHTNACGELFDKQALAMSWWCFVNISEAKSTVPARFHNCLIIVPVIKHFLKVSGSHWTDFFFFFFLIYFMGTCPWNLGRSSLCRLRPCPKEEYELVSHIRNGSLCWAQVQVNYMETEVRHGPNLSHLFE